MAYPKLAPSRAKYVTPSDTKDITPAWCAEASGAGATVHDAAGVIDDVTLAAGTFGSGYIVAPDVTISDGVGVGCILEAVMDELGAIASITIVDGGTGYTAAGCTVTVSGGEFPVAQPCILYCGTGGAATTIKVTTEGGDELIFNAPLSGTILGGSSPIHVKRVWDTDTTAGFDTLGNLIAMW